MSRRSIWIAAVAAVAIVPLAAQAQLSMNYDFFKVWNNAVNPDFFGHGIDGTIVTGIVKNAIGPDGLPVASGLVPPSGPITQKEADGELKWWTPDGTNIVADGSGVVVGPLNYDNFFATGQTNNDTWYRTAIFRGTINVLAPTNYSFSLGADDDAWLFIDGMLVGDNGGIKAYGPMTYNTGLLGSGSHDVALFFADRHQVQSALHFTPQFTVTATPEPASLTLLATGLIGIAGAVRRRRQAA